MVWDVLEAWGDDPSSHPVIHKSKGTDRVSPKPPLSDLADASNDFDVFFATAKIAKTANEGMDPPSFPAAVATKTAKTVTVGPWSFRRAFEPLRLEGPNKNKGMDPSKIKFH